VKASDDRCSSLMKRSECCNDVANRVTKALPRNVAWLLEYWEIVPESYHTAPIFHFLACRNVLTQHVS
jgi:hypothetical protein